MRKNDPISHIMAKDLQADKIQYIETQLRKEKARLVDLLSRTSQHFNRDEPHSADFAEQASETENDQVVEALDAEARIELSAVSDALQRIEKGSYGFCQACEEAINPARLEAIPYAENCIHCASKAT